MKKFTLNPIRLFNRYLSSKPWVDITYENGELKVKDWNTAAINQYRVNPDKPSESIAAKIKVHEQLKKDEPFAEIIDEQVTEFNAAYLQRAKETLETFTVVSDKSDKEIVQMYYDREKIQNSTDPYLKIVHHEIKDGRIRLELDWNTAFIDQLRSLGFPAGDEEDMVRDYLQSLTMEQFEQRIEELKRELGELTELNEFAKTKKA